MAVYATLLDGSIGAEVALAITNTLSPFPLVQFIVIEVALVGVVTLKEVACVLGPVHVGTISPVLRIIALYVYEFTVKEI